MTNTMSDKIYKLETNIQSVVENENATIRDLSNSF